VIAATLLLIKSKSLLPNLELSIEEEENIKDLEDRLQLYNIYKIAKDALAVHIASNHPLYEPKQIKTSIYTSKIFAPAANINMDVLARVIKSVLQQLPQTEKKQKAEIVPVVNIEDVMSTLLMRVESALQNSFTDITGRDRQEILVNFLALLELVKEGVLLARQGDIYGDILLTKQDAVV